MGKLSAIAVTLILLVTIFFAGAAVAGQNKSRDIEILYKRVFNLLSGSAGGTTGPLYKQAVGKLDKRVGEIMKKEFPTLDLKDKKAHFKINDLFSRLQTLSRAYQAQGSTYHKSKELKEKIQHGLKRGTPFLVPAGPARPGTRKWSTWTFGIHPGACAVAVLMHKELDAPIKKPFIASLRPLLGKLTFSGANAVWEAYNQFLLSVVVKDWDRLDRARAHVIPELTVRTEGSVLEDYSYQFHGRILYTGGYGSGYGFGLAQFIYLLDGTAWEFTKDKKQLLINYLLEHAQWVAVNKHYDISVKGRGALGAGSTKRLVGALIYLSEVKSERQREIVEAASRAAAYHPTFDLELSGLVDNLKQEAAQPLTGFRYYYASDFGVFRGKNFYVSVRMHSSRTMDYEYLNGNGSQLWNMSSGFTYVSRMGHELWEGEDKPIKRIDWDRLPGTTSRIGSHPVNNATIYGNTLHSLNFGRSEYSGGAGTEAGGMMGFVLVPIHGDFVAYKTYMFFDQGFVALGSGISSTQKRYETVNTTVAQWPTAKPGMVLSLSGKRELADLPRNIHWDDVRWAFVDNTGYIFPTGVTLHCHRKGGLVTLWLEHGKNPQDGSYAYMVLPNTTLTAVKAFTKNPPVSILSQTKKMHVVLDKSTGATGYVFWKAGSHGDLFVDAPAIIYRKQGKQGSQIAIQNPLYTEKMITVSFKERHKLTAHAPEMVVADYKGKTVIKTSTVMGRMYRAGFGVAGKKLRQQRRENLLDYYKFKVDAESTPTVTTLTVYLPAEAVQTEYILKLHGYRDHVLRKLTDKDIIDWPAPNVVRYKWVRKSKKEEDRKSWREYAGSFRLKLHSGFKGSRAYFSVYEFDEQGNELVDKELLRDRERRR